MQIVIDKSFIRAADGLRRSRGWRHLFALGLGGLVLLTGALALAVIATGYKGGESAAGMSAPVAAALYGCGSVAMAWGAAYGSKHSYAWWLVVTVLAGGVLALAIFAGGALGGASSGGGDGSSGEQSPDAAKQPGLVSVAAVIADRGLAEMVLGPPVDGPFRVTRTRRGKTNVIWYGEGTYADRPLLSAQVRHRSNHGAVAATVKRAKAAGGAELVAATGWSRNWQVAMNLRCPHAGPELDQVLIRRVNEGLTALDSTD